MNDKIKSVGASDGKSNKGGKKAKQKADNTFSMKAPKTDPDGSWTGVPKNPGEEPVQDADDL